MEPAADCIGDIGECLLFGYRLTTKWKKPHNLRNAIDTEARHRLLTAPAVRFRHDPIYVYPHIMLEVL
jgi:hypothetical protein